MNLTGPCPRCGSHRIAPVAIGYPDLEMEAAASRGEFILGGDVLTLDLLQQNVGCLDCRHRWHDPSTTATEQPSFEHVIEPIQSQSEPITFDEFVDTALAEATAAFEVVTAPDADIAPFLVTVNGPDAFLIRWARIDPSADPVSELVPGTLATTQANMAALVLPTFPSDSAKRSQAILVHCVAQEGAGVFRESSFAASITRAERQPATLTRFDALGENAAPAISASLRTALSRRTRRATRERSSKTSPSRRAGRRARPA